MQNNKFPAELVRQFNQPAGMLYRAFDHLIGSRPGMTLMVPVVISSGRLDGLVDQCPVPLLEAAAILDADYAGAEQLDMNALVSASYWCRLAKGKGLEGFGQLLVSQFLGTGGVCTQDTGWRHAQIHLSAGGAPCRVLIGTAGVRLAFTPDLFGGVL